MRRSVLTYQDAFNAVERCRVPVLAAIQGGCIGGGVDLIAFGLLIILMVVKQPSGMIGIIRNIHKRYLRRKSAVKGDEPHGTP